MQESVQRYSEEETSESTTKFSLSSTSVILTRSIQSATKVATHTGVGVGGAKVTKFLSSAAALCEDLVGTRHRQARHTRREYHVHIVAELSPPQPLRFLVGMSTFVARTLNVSTSSAPDFLNGRRTSRSGQRQHGLDKHLHDDHVERPPWSAAGALCGRRESRSGRRQHSLGEPLRGEHVERLNMVCAECSKWPS